MTTFLLYVFILRSGFPRKLLNLMFSLVCEGVHSVHSFNPGIFLVCRPWLGLLTEGCGCGMTQMRDAGCEAVSLYREHAGTKQMGYGRARRPWFAGFLYEFILFKLFPGLQGGVFGAGLPMRAQCRMMRL